MGISRRWSCRLAEALNNKEQEEDCNENTSRLIRCLI